MNLSQSFSVTDRYTVEITSCAQNDIAQIWEFIAKDNPRAADSFIRYLEEQIKTLEMFPLRCPSVPENEILGTDYRQLIFGNYRIIVKILHFRVIIMRIFHQARVLDIDILYQES